MKRCAKKAVFCLILALVLLPWPLVLTASAEGGAGEITAQCAYALPEDVPAERLTDGSLLTRLTLRSKKELSVALPACRRPSLYVTWFARPSALTVTELDGEDKLAAVEYKNAVKHGHGLWPSKKAAELLEQLHIDL